MLDETYPSDEYDESEDGFAHHCHPDAVLSDATLSIAKKRAILASWASDARAILDAPALRRLDDGTVLHIDSILEALKRLDNVQVSLPSKRARSFVTRRHWDALRRAGRSLATPHRNDDDDDPPPAPAAAAIPRPAPSLDGSALVAA